MTPKNSRDLQGSKAWKDEARETEELIVEGTGEAEGEDRDLVHGEGGAIDLPVKPGDMSKDD